jgi:thymidine phosphorylase
VCDDPAAFLPLVSETVKVESPRSGFITRVDTTEIGHAIAAIGGGRVRIEDTIDPTVGFTSELKIGDQVSAGDEIGVVYCADSSSADDAARRIQAAYHIGEQPPAQIEKLVKEIINE